MERAFSHRTTIGVGVSTFAVAAMAVDHLMGDDPGLDDLLTFVLASGLTLTLAIVVFGVVVPRALADPATAATRGIILSLLSVPLMVTIWLGLPFATAGGGVVLGLAGRRGRHARRATAAIVIAAALLLLGSADYVEQAIRKTW